MIKNNIILMGIKHCGKSTQGKLLAKKMNCDFYDIDDLVEKKYEPNRYCSVRKIFQTEGIKVFKNLEAKSTCELSDKIINLGNSIIALGGSTIENDIAMHCISGLCLLVYLEENIDILYNRIIEEGLPPFLSKNNSYNDFKNIYNNRSKIYKNNADIIIKINGRTINETTELILSKLKEIGYAR